MQSSLSQLPPIVDCNLHPNQMLHGGVNLPLVTHSVQMQGNGVHFAHQLLHNPTISTLMKAVRKGFLKGCSNMSEKIILKYLNPSPPTAKGCMKRPCHGIWSTRPKTHTAPIVVPVPIIPPVLPPFDGNIIHDKFHPTIPGPALIDDDTDKSIAFFFVLGLLQIDNQGMNTTIWLTTSCSCCTMEASASW
jgi:hypothetical protein